jgi:MFS family permease
MSYRALLRAAPRFFLPLGLLARLPYAMTPIATLLATRSATGSLAFAGTVAALQSVSMGVAGLMIGALADRLGSRRVGAVAAISCALMTLTLLTATETATGQASGHGSGRARAVILVCSAGAGLTQPGIGLLTRVHWSVSLDRQGKSNLLPTALSWESVADEMSFVAGPALVGVLAAVRPALALALIVALLLCAAVPVTLAVAQTTDAPATGDNTRDEQPPRQVRPGPRLPRFGTAALLVGMACIGTVFGTVQIGVTRLAAESGRPADAGLLYALLGLGSAAAGFVYPWLPSRVGWRARYLGASIGLLVGCTVLLAGAGGLLPLPVAVAGAGLAVSPYLISLFGAIERIMPPRRYTTGLAIVCGGSAVGSAFGQVVGGILAQRSALLTVAVAAVAAGLAVLVAATFTVSSAGRGGP